MHTDPELSSLNYVLLMAFVLSIYLSIYHWCAEGLIFLFGVYACLIEAYSRQQAAYYLVAEPHDGQTKQSELQDGA